MKDKKILTEEDRSFFKTIDAMYRKSFETKEDPIIDVIEELIKYKNQLLAKKMEEIFNKLNEEYKGDEDSLREVKRIIRSLYN